MSDPRPASTDPTIAPYLVVTNADEVIEFLTHAYGATTRARLTRSNGTVMHAEVCIGDSVVMIGEAMEGFEPTKSHIFLRVDDADAAHRRAVAAGGTVFMEPTTMEHAGERYGGVSDPGGNTWWASRKVEDVPLEEQQKRIDERGL